MSQIWKAVVALGILVGALTFILVLVLGAVRLTTNGKLCGVEFHAGEIVYVSEDGLCQVRM